MLRTRAAAGGAPRDRPRAASGSRQAIAGTARRRRATTAFASLGAAGDPEHLRRLREANRAPAPGAAHLSQGAATRPASSRVLCPYAIVFTSGMWYVVANCGDEGLRFFRLDRVEDVEVLEERYEPPQRLLARGGDARTGGPSRRRTPASLRVRYSPEVARWIAEREGKAVEADGSLVMEHPLADTDWAVRHVLQYGPDAEVLEPAAVREEIVRRLTAMAT